MSAIVRIQIIEAMGLPIMDRISDLTDAFVEVTFGINSFKTDVAWKTLNPIFNSEVFEFEVSDEELLLNMLHIRLMDYDMCTSHNVVGKVCISLSPLVLGTPRNYLFGWFPLYDTMHGNRGYIKIYVKLKPIGNKIKGILPKNHFRLFTFDSVPFGWELIEIHGLINFIRIENDTEDNWIDFIRSSRSSNEARQSLFRDLYLRLTEEIITTAINLGGNAILGFRVNFDIEGETSVIARVLGTCVTMTQCAKNTTHNSHPTNSIICTPTKLRAYRLSHITPNIDFHFYDPDNVKLDKSMSILRKNAIHYKNGKYNIPICNIKRFPDDMQGPIGGIITTMSVRVIENKHPISITRIYKQWWEELRLEIKQQAYNLNCDTVGGYSEVVTMHDKFIAMFAYATAFSSISTPSIDKAQKPPNCILCHIPYNPDIPPFQMGYTNCKICKNGVVSELLMTNMHKPDILQCNGLGCLVQASVYKQIDNEKEITCYELNQNLTFVSYELHLKLIHKLKIMGLNSLFNLTIDICLTDDSIFSTAVGTGYILDALPLPHCPIIEFPKYTILSENLDLIEDAKNKVISNISTIRSYMKATSITNETDNLQPIDVKNDIVPSTNEHQNIAIKVEGVNPINYVSDLMDPIYIDSFHITNSQRHKAISSTKIITNSFIVNLVKTLPLGPSFDDCTEHDSHGTIDSYVSSKFKQEIIDSLQYIYFKMRHVDYCTISNVQIEVIKHDNSCFLRIFANVDCFSTLSQQTQPLDITTNISSTPVAINNINKSNKPDVRHNLFETTMTPICINAPTSTSFEQNYSSMSSLPSSILNHKTTYSIDDNIYQNYEINNNEITITCSYNLPEYLDCSQYQHVGILSFIFIREITDLKKGSSIGIISFINTFLVDVQEIAKSYAKSFGANFILGFNMSDFQIDYSDCKSDAYCLCQVSGNMFSSDAMIPQLIQRGIL